jgi:folate-dependent tRNA-U54 methylase TrmFO/GidA
MRGKVNTEAHVTSNFAELICSNSLRAKAVTNAVGLLKEEMNQLDSLIMKAAYETEEAKQYLALQQDYNYLFSGKVGRV